MRSLKFAVCLSVVSCLISCASLESGNGYFVENKKPVSVIVIPAKASETEKFAAEELRKYFEKTTDASLLIKKDSEKISSPLLSVGKTSFARANSDVQKDLAGLNDVDEYIIRNSGSKLFLCGKGDRGTLYSVYNFIEKYLGTRWYAPGKIGEVIQKKSTVSVPAVADIQKPDFKIRAFTVSVGSRAKCNVDIADWAVKNRLNMDLLSYSYRYFPELKDFYKKRGGALFFLKAGHNYQSFFLPPKEYFKEHPEYYPLVNGERRWSNAQICLSNPEARQIIIDKMIKNFDANPDALGHGFCPEDNNRVECECAECRKLDPKNNEMYKGKIPYVTDRMLKTARFILDKVHEKYPGKKLYLLAYNATGKPPLEAQVDDDMIFSLCPHKDMLVPLCEDKEKKAVIEGWAQKTPNLIIGSLIYMHPVQLYGKTEHIIRDMRYLHGIGITGIKPMMLNMWGMYGGMYNLNAAMMWNVNIDPEKFLDEYYRLYYGKAGEWKQKFDQLFEKMISDKEVIVYFQSRKPFNLGRFYINYPLYSKTLDGYMEKAFNSEKADPVITARLQAAEDGWTFFKLFHDMLKSMKAYSDAPENMDLFLKARNDWKKACAFVKKKMKNPHTLGFDSFVRKLIRRYRGRINNYEKELREKARIFKGKKSVELRNWKFKTDPENKGTVEKWFKLTGKDFRSWKNIKAGCFWENVGYKDYDGVAWYMKTFKLPDYKKGDNVGLYFEAVDNFAYVYVNGKLVGKHEGEIKKTWNEPFYFDISKEVKAGKNTIAVKVVDVSAGGGMHGNAYLLTGK